MLTKSHRRIGLRLSSRQKFRDARRRLAIEGLEDRTMLDGTSLTSTQVSQFIESARGKIAAIQAQANNLVSGALTALPIIGKSTKDLFGPANDTGATLNGVFNAIEAQLDAADNFVKSHNQAYTQTLIQQTLFDNLKDYLGDQNGDGLNAQDVVITNFNPTAASITVDLDLVKAFTFSKSLAFSLGLPGFPFQVTSGSNVGLDLTLSLDHLKFGLATTTSQPFVDVSASTFGVGVTATYSTGEIDAQFGFLAIQNIPGQAPTLGLGGSIDFGFDTTSGTLTAPQLNVTASVDLPFQTKDLGNIPVIDVKLPEFQADLKVSWPILRTNPNGAITTFGDNGPDVSLEDVKVSVGGLLGTLATPAMAYLQYLLLPMQAAVSVLNAPIPGLSDLWQLAFDKDVSLLSLANVISDIDVLPPEFKPIVEAADVVSGLIESINGLTSNFSTDLGNSYISVGSVDFSELANGAKTDLRSLQSGWGNQSITDFLGDPANFGTPLTGLAPYVQPIATKLVDRLSSLPLPDSVKNDPNYQQAIDHLKQAIDGLGSKVSLSFPLIDDPSGSVFKLFLGIDTQFVNFTIDLPDLEIAQANAFDVPIGGDVLGTIIKESMPVKFDGGLVASVYLNMGYDTRGLRDLFHSGITGLADGFEFTVDPNRPLFSLNGTMSATVGPDLDVGIGALSAGVSGSLNSNIRLVIAGSSDGTFRPSLDSNADTPVLHGSGKVTASISAGAYVRVGTDSFNKKFYLLGPYDIGSVVLLDLDSNGYGNPYQSAVFGGEPSASISDATVTRSQTGTVPATFTVTLSWPVQETVSVGYVTVVGGSASASDFVATSGTLVFQPGEYRKTITVNVNGTTAMGQDKTFVVNLVNPALVKIDDNFGLGTIHNPNVQGVYTTPTGPLDATFGTAGLSAPVASTSSNAFHALAYDSNGRLLAIGGSSTLPEVVRYNPNGTLDTTFNSSGVATTTVGGLGYSGAVYPSGPNKGKILLVGYVSFPFITKIRVTQLNADGTPDLTFGPTAAGAGSGSGFLDIETPPYASARNQGTAIAIHPDGLGFDVIGNNTTGGSNGEFIVVGHFNANGSPIKTAFTNNDGKPFGILKITGPDAKAAGALEAAYGPDGLLYLGGFTSANGATLIRLNSGGQLDQSFGIGGYAAVPLGGSVSGTQINDFKFQADGKIVVVVNAVGIGGNYLAIGRLNANGMLDTAFNQSGLRIDTINNGRSLTGVAIQPDGKIVATGFASSGAKFMAVRFLPDGSLDSTYSTDGTGFIFSTPTGASGVNNTTPAIIDAQGSAVAGGNVVKSGTAMNNFGVVRYEEPRANLGISISATTPTAPAGGTVTYLINLANTGDDAALPSWKLTLPAGLTFVSISGDTRWAFSTPAVGLNGTIIAGARLLKANDFTGAPDDTTFVLVVHVDGNYQPPASVTMTVVAGSATLDPVTANNTASVTLPVDPLLLSITGTTVPEGNSGTTGAVFTVSLNNASWQTVTVGYKTVAGGTATTADFTSVSGTLTFAPGETSKTIVVPVIGNTTPQFDRTFLVNLTAPGVGTPLNAIIATNIAYGTITDDDSGAVFNPTGPLDVTFNATGTKTQSLPGIVKGTAVAVDASDRIIAGGAPQNSLGLDFGFAIARYNPNGTLDTTFGGTGLLNFNPFTNPNTGGGLEAVDVEKSGTNLNKVVAMGGGLMYRFNIDGMPDTTFGTNGVVSTGLTPVSDSIYRGGIYADKIVIAGGSFVYRYNLDGTLDKTFNGTGMSASLRFGNNTARIYGVATTPDGKIIVTGDALPSSTHTFFIARYNADGTLDSTFGTTLPMAMTANGIGYAITIDPLGRPVVAGKLANSGGGVARFTAAGALDTTFNGTGYQTDNFSNNINLTFDAVAVGPDLRVIAADKTIGRGLVARFNADGSKDYTFGSQTTLNPNQLYAGMISGRSTTATALAVTSTGGIVVNGTSTATSGPNDSTMFLQKIEPKRANLAVTGFATPTTVPAGQTLTYTYSVTNQGDSADYVSFSELIPANTTFVSATAPAGWTLTTPAVGGTGTIFANRRTFAAADGAQTITVTLKPIVLPRNTVIATTAKVASATVDPVTTNNSMNINATVANGPPTVSISLNTSTPAPGDTLTATAIASDPNNDPVSLTFVWQVNGQTVQTHPLGAGQLVDTLSLAGLQAGARIVLTVTPSDGLVTGAVAVASAIVTAIPVTPPTVTTQSATSIKTTGATLNATVNPNGSTTTTGFQYSTDPSIPTNVVTTYAGGNGYGSTDGAAASAKFDEPLGVAIDASGNIFVADTFNHTIRKITSAGVVSTIAGTPGVAGSADGVGASALFRDPQGIAVDGAGNLYVADSLNNTIRFITFVNGVANVSTLAGQAGPGLGFADGHGTAAKFAYPIDVAVDPAGNVYVADAGNSAIRKISVLGDVTTVVGVSGQQTNTDGDFATARFINPYGVAFDGSGNLYVADAGSNTIRKITFATATTGVVTTLAGSPGQHGNTDGTGSAARFYTPQGIDVDASGNIYVGDFNNQEIRKITPSGVVTTLAGSPGNSNGNNGVGATAGISHPGGVALDASGNIYVAAFGDNAVRKLSTPSILSATSVNASGPVAVALSGLQANTTYYYRAVASNAGGQALGQIFSFTTLDSTPKFGELTGVAAVYGTSQVSIFGQINSPDGSFFSPGEFVNVTINGVTEQAPISAGGAIGFNFILPTSPPFHAGTYKISFDYPGDGNFGPVSSGAASPSLTIQQNVPIVGLTYPQPRVANGVSTFPVTPYAIGHVAGFDDTPQTFANQEAGTFTVTYYAGFGVQPGTTLPGTTTPPSLPGDYTALVHFNGSIDYTPADATPIGYTITDGRPFAQDDSYNANRAATLAVDADHGVLANDVDPFGRSIHAVLDTTTAHGALALSSDGSFSYQPNGSYFGLDTFTYHAEAADGSRSPAVVVRISVSPVVAADDHYNVGAGSLLIAAPGVLGNDTDASGSALSAVVVQSPSHGQLTLNADGSFSYQADFGYSGTDSLRYKASDGTYDSLPATVTFFVTSASIQAVDDEYATTFNSPLTVDAAHGPLANDANVPGGTHSALSLSVVSLPAHGSLTIAADGSFMYTPDDNFYGVDVFTYQAVVNAQASRTATVEFDVSPISVPDQSYQAVRSRTLVLGVSSDLLANLVDIAPFTIVGITDVSASNGGSVTIEGDGSAATGSLVFTPADGFEGVASFTFRAHDAGGFESLPVTVSIQVTPVLARDDAFVISPPARTANFSKADLLANDVDLDAGNASDLTISEIGTPAHGSLSIADDGSYLYTPDTGFFGIDSFTYRANNGTFDSNLATVTINVGSAAVDDSYIITPNPSPTTGLTVDATHGVLANDSPNAAFVGLVSGATHGEIQLDLDGSIRFYDDTDPNTGLPNLDPVQFNYEAYDTAGTDIGRATVTLNIVPVYGYDLQFNILKNQPTSLDLVDPALNLKGASLSVQIVNGPAHGTLTLSDDGITPTYTPDSGYTGADQFTYTLSDGTRTYNVATVDLTVAALFSANYRYSVADGIEFDGFLSELVDGTYPAGESPVTVDLATVIGPMHASDFTIGPDGMFAYTGNLNYFGVDSFSFELVNALGEHSPRATVLFTVFPVNIQSENYTANQDSTLTVAAPGVLANDDNLNNDSIFPVIYANPLHGQLTMAQDGSFTYTPDPGFSGFDVFRYYDYDTTRDNIASGFIVPDFIVVQPVAAEDGSVDVDLGNFIDAEYPDSLKANLIFSVADASHGTITLLSDGHTARFTPAANYNGPASFNFTYATSADPNFHHASRIDLSITPVNDAPVATDGATSVVAGTPDGVVIDLTGLVSDVETAPSDMTYTIVDPPALAAGTLVPIIGHVGQFRFIPAPGYTGQASFTYQVTDTGDPTGSQGNSLSSAVATFRINVVSSLAIQSVVNSGPVSYGQSVTISVTATGQGALSYTFLVDADGVIQTNSGADNQVKILFSTAGTHHVGVRVTDGGGHSVQGDTDVVVNKATTNVEFFPQSYVYNRSAQSASGQVDVVGIPTDHPGPLTFTYYAGSSASGTQLASAPVNAGTYTVVASYAGDANHLAASATVSLVIAKATPTIIWDNPAPITYGTPITSIQYNATSDSDAQAIYPFALGTIYHAQLGRPLTVAYNETANYFAASKTVTIDILKYATTVTAGPIDLLHGDILPTPTYTFGPLVNGDKPAVIAGAPGYQTTYGPTTAAGLYPITPTVGTLSSSDYTFRFVASTVTVHPKVLDIRALYGPTDAAHPWGRASVSLQGLTRDLPFSNIGAIEVLFSDDVQLAGSPFNLNSVLNQAQIVPVSYSTGTSSRDIVWKLPTALGVDMLTASIDRTRVIANLAGSPINLGGTSSWNFDVLPGDFNGDRTVKSDDMVAIKNQIGTYLITGDSIPGVNLADLNGDGVVDAEDVKIAQGRLGKTLPHAR